MRKLNGFPRPNSPVPFAVVASSCLRLRDYIFCDKVYLSHIYIYLPENALYRHHAPRLLTRGQCQRADPELQCEGSRARPRAYQPQLCSGPRCAAQTPSVSRKQCSADPRPSLGHGLGGGGKASRGSVLCYARIVVPWRRCKLVE